MSRVHPHAVGRAAAILVVASLLLAACGGSTDATGPGGVSLRIDDPWIRVPMAPTGPAGAFMTIANTGADADALLSVSTPAATAAEVHETTMAADGSMGMRPIERLEVPAGGTVELRSGSHHLMLIGLTTELAAGDTVELTLTFERAGPVTVTAEVRGG